METASKKELYYVDYRDYRVRLINVAKHYDASRWLLP